MGNAMKQCIRKSAYSLALLALGVMSAYAAAPITEITLPGSRLFTESITSTKDGAIIVGSVGKGSVSRIPPGSIQATEWIKPGANGLKQVFGVYADEPHHTLWVCSDGNAPGEAVLKSFDLKTAATKGSSPATRPSAMTSPSPPTVPHTYPTPARPSSISFAPAPLLSKRPPATRFSKALTASPLANIPPSTSTAMTTAPSSASISAATANLPKSPTSSSPAASTVPTACAPSARTASSKPKTPAT